MILGFIISVSIGFDILEFDFCFFMRDLYPFHKANKVSLNRFKLHEKQKVEIENLNFILDSSSR